MRDDQRAPGEGGRFDEMWREHHGFLLRYARRRLPTAELAEEAVAEAFATAWLHRRRVPAEPQTRLWLTRATFHAVSNSRRKQHRQGDLIGRLSRQRPSSDSALWPDGLTDAQARLARAMEQLDGKDRELLRLAVWEGFDHAQIGEVTDLSTSNVAVRLHRARARLRALMDVPAPSPSHRPSPACTVPQALGDLS